MSYFAPYINYKVALPSLKPGHIFKIAGKFYQIITVRHNRKKVTISGAQATTYLLYVTTAAALADLTGNINLSRVVHLQYVSIDVDTNTQFWWGTQPLQSKDVAEDIQTWAANLANPLEIDRWSYDDSMNLGIRQAATQNYYFELVEYEVQPYAGTPPRPYLFLMANGQGIFVQEGTVEPTLQPSLGR